MAERKPDLQELARRRYRRRAPSSAASSAGSTPAREPSAFSAPQHQQRQDLVAASGPRPNVQEANGNVLSADVTQPKEQKTKSSGDELDTALSSVLVELGEQDQKSKQSQKQQEGAAAVFHNNFDDTVPEDRYLGRRARQQQEGNLQADGASGVDSMIEESDSDDEFDHLFSDVYGDGGENPNQILNLTDEQVRNMSMDELLHQYVTDNNPVAQMLRGRIGGPEDIEPGSDEDGTETPFEILTRLTVEGQKKLDAKRAERAARGENVDEQEKRSQQLGLGGAGMLFGQGGGAGRSLLEKLWSGGGARQGLNEQLGLGGGAGQGLGDAGEQLGLGDGTGQRQGVQLGLGGGAGRSLEEQLGLGGGAGRGQGLQLGLGRGAGQGLGNLGVQLGSGGGAGGEGLPLGLGGGAGRGLGGVGMQLGLGGGAGRGLGGAGMPLGLGGGAGQNQGSGMLPPGSGGGAGRGLANAMMHLGLGRGAGQGRGNGMGIPSGLGDGSSRGNDGMALLQQLSEAARQGQRLGGGGMDLESLVSQGIERMSADEQQTLMQLVGGGNMQGMQQQMSRNQSNSDAEEIDPNNADFNEILHQLLALETMRAENNGSPRAGGMNTVIIMDTSGSMVGEPFIQATEFISDFINGLEEVQFEYNLNESVALVTVGQGIQVIQHLTSDYSLIRQAAAGMLAEGPSPLHMAMVLPVAVFSKQRYQNHLVSGLYGQNGHVIRPRVIVISDGHLSKDTEPVGTAPSQEEMVLQTISIELLQSTTLHTMCRLNCVPVGAANMDYLEMLSTCTGGQLMTPADARLMSRHFLHHTLAAGLKNTGVNVADPSVLAQHVRNVVACADETDMESVRQIINEPEPNLGEADQQIIKQAEKGGGGNRQDQAQQGQMPRHGATTPFQARPQLRPGGMSGLQGSGMAEPAWFQVPNQGLPQNSFLGGQGLHSSRPRLQHPFGGLGGGRGAGDWGLQQPAALQGQQQMMGQGQQGVRNPYQVHGHFLPAQQPRQQAPRNGFRGHGFDVDGDELELVNQLEHPENIPEYNPAYHSRQGQPRPDVPGGEG